MSRFQVCLCVLGAHIHPFKLQPNDEEKEDEKKANEENNFVYSCLSIGHTKSGEEKCKQTDAHKHIYREREIRGMAF